MTGLCRLAWCVGVAFMVAACSPGQGTLKIRGDSGLPAVSTGTPTGTGTSTGGGTGTGTPTGTATGTGTGAPSAPVIANATYADANPTVIDSFEFTVDVSDVDGDLLGGRVEIDLDGTVLQFDIPGGLATWSGDGYAGVATIHSPYVPCDDLGVAKPYSVTVIDAAGLTSAASPGTAEATGRRVQFVADTAGLGEYVQLDPVRTAICTGIQMPPGADEHDRFEFGYLSATGIWSVYLHNQGDRKAHV